MSTSTGWYAYISVSLDHRNLDSDVHKFRQSVIFLRVYNFPNEEDSVGELIQNQQEEWSVESDPRWARKIPRSPGNLLHCGPSCLSAVLMNIQHSSVDHLQGTKQTASSWQSSKRRAACHPLHFGQAQGALPGARPSSSCSFWEGHPQLPLFPPQHQQPSHHSSHPPSLLVQRVTIKLKAAKEHSRWLMTKNSGSKETC